MTNEEEAKAKVFARADALLADLAKRRQDRIDAEAAAGGTTIETRTMMMEFPLPIPVHLAGIVDAIAENRGLSSADVLRELGMAHAEKMLISIVIQLENLGGNRN